MPEDHGIHPEARLIAPAPINAPHAGAFFYLHALERLPVVSDAHSRRLIGIVSRSDLIKPALSLHAEEPGRQTVRRLWQPRG